MFFRNVLTYKFTTPFELTAEELEQTMHEHAFVPCGRLDRRKTGWTSPMGAMSEMLVHAANNAFMVCLMIQEKVLPSAVVREKLQAKVAEIEVREDRRVRKKEKEGLKDEIIHDCLPTAFTRSKRVYAYIDATEGRLYVNAGTFKQAEEVCSLLRESIGTLPVVPLQVSDSPSITMTSWLRGEGIPKGFTFGDQVQLEETCEGGAVATFKKQDLQSDELESLIDNGKQAKKLSIEWDHAASFSLRDDLAVLGLKFSDEVVSEAKDSSDGDKAAQFDADFAIMVLTIRKLFSEIIDAFGGHVQVA